MSKNYTKGKWVVEKSSYYETVDICAEEIEPEDIVCVFWHLDEETHDRFEYDNAEANAERICQCVNNFDVLLAALKDALNLIDIARQYFPKSIKNNHKFQLENTCATIGKVIHQVKSTNNG